MGTKRVSQKDIAERLGVHVTTVSMALRDSPRLPVKTRKRVQAMAKKMGYQPDPILNALMVYRQRMRSPHFQGTLAWLNIDKRDGAPPGRGSAEYQAGAAERCKELGWQLSEFRIEDTSPDRLAKILHSRNIQGLLLPPPQPGGISHLDFDWAPFSALSIGFTMTHPRLHLVANAQYRSARQAVRAIRSLGYERIGFATIPGNELRTNQNFSSGYLAQERSDKQAGPPLFIFDDTGKSGRKKFISLFSKWIDRHRPDAILALDDDVPGAMKTLGISSKTCGLALLHVTPKTKGMAGISQNDFMIGSSAVDYLVGMIHRNERGLPDIPLQILVDGTWVDGASLPQRA
ncbi:MAG: LacI family DNA-binding transcriptional regulator [Chthoniobacterales bacterium]